MVHNRGIEVNLEKIQALLDMKSLIKVKDVRRLTGCIVALNRFIAQTTGRCLLFFKALKKGSEIIWTDDCEQSFQELKLYLGRALILSKPIEGETLSLCLAVYEAAISAVLIWQKETK